MSRIREKGGGEIVSIQTTQFVILPLMSVCPQNDTCHLLVNVPHSAPHNAICPGLTVIQPALIQSAPCHHIPFVLLRLSICLSSFCPGFFALPLRLSRFLLTFYLLEIFPKDRRWAVLWVFIWDTFFFQKIHLFGCFHHSVVLLYTVVLYHRMT